MNRILQLLLVSFLSLSATAQTITTWSGSTIGNSNGSLAATKWAQPHSMCTDGLGNIWVSDEANHCIKMIQGGTTVYTRVGSAFAPGTAGAYGYTNAFSIAALFNGPKGIVCDASNNIYVCDWWNNAIRKIDAFTTIGNAQGVTTLCGAPATTGIAVSGNTDGVGTNARFNHPSGICKDNSGNFYVTDEDNHMIRKIVIATGTVTTLCGAASGTVGALLDGNFATAKFKSPRGITFSAAENALYVSDFGNGRIRKIDLTAQTVTVWAGGSGLQGSDGNRLTAANVKVPEGIVLDALGNVIFSSGVNANTVRRVDKSSNLVFTFAGTHQTPGTANGIYTDSRFNTPTGLMLSGSILYVCDNANSQIRAIDLKPVVDFYSNYTVLTAGATATLKDTSLSMVSSWSWTISPGTVNVDYQFVNSTSATSQNPQIKFTTANIYNVKLDATNAYGTSSKTKTSYIVVNSASGAPVANFTANKLWGDINTTFIFTNQTTNYAGCLSTWGFAPSTISYLSTTSQNSDNPQVRFSNIGLYSVTLSITHPSFTVAPITKTNFIKISGVGISEVQNEFLFNIFPNPNHGNFTIISSENMPNAKVNIYDMQGRMVASKSLLNLQEQNLALPHLNAGVYLVKITSQEKVATQRLVIQ